MIGALVLALVATLVPGYSDLGYCGRTIVDDHNRHRVEAGLAPLAVDWRMHIYALKHARAQRAEGKAFHSDQPVYSENVGYAPDVLTLNVAWRESPGHRANILDPSYRFIGPGCARAGGRVYGTVTFR